MKRSDLMIAFRKEMEADDASLLDTFMYNTLMRVYEFAFLLKEYENFVALGDALLEVLTKETSGGVG